jgi:hypothetical protein
MQTESIEDENKRTNSIKFAISIRDQQGQTTINPYIKINDNNISTNPLIPCEHTELFNTYSYDIYSYIRHDIRSYYCMQESTYKSSDIILDLVYFFLI